MGWCFTHDNEKYKNWVHISTKLTLTQAFEEEKERRTCLEKFLDKWKKNKPKFQINNLVRTPNIKRTFSKGDAIIWSFELNKTREIISHTIPIYGIDSLPESYNETLLKKTEKTLEENEEVMKKLKIT